MNNYSALLRSFIIFGVCVVLAVWLGFLLTGPLTYSSVVIYAILAFIMVSPLLLRLHYPLMLLTWNMGVTIFVLPGNPMVGWCMIGLSLAFSVLQRMISPESRFIQVPQIILPLLSLFIVVAVTARLTGFGFRVFGGDVYGSAKYVSLVAGIIGYFALSARRIPPERVNLYLGLFFLGGVTYAIGDLVPFLPRSLYYIFWVFQPNINFFQNTGPGAEATRLNGLRMMCSFIFPYMLARYGIRGMFYSGKPWRWIIFLIFFTLGLFGGFRGYVIGCGLLFGIQFLLEGLHKTRLMAVFLTFGILGALALIPVSDRLPYSFQRAITFLPYKVSAAARLDAEGSWEWRVNMWNALLPEIPNDLLLGKGYAISPQDFKFVMGPEASVHTTFAQNQALALASDFHSGPISVIIPFGIWGCVAFLWFLIAGAWAVYRNYRYSDPALKRVNTFLLAAYVSHVIFFFFFFGGLDIDVLVFSGYLGLSVSINGGVCRRRVRAVQPDRETSSPRGFVPVPESPVPAFQRRQPGLGRQAGS